MTVTLELKPEVEQGLQAQAQAQACGVSLNDYLQEIVTRQARQAASIAGSGPTSPELPVLHLGAMDSLHRADLYNDVR